MVDLEGALSPEARAWLHGVALDDKVALLAAYSGAARKVGKTLVGVGGRGSWGMDEVARAALLVNAYPRIVPDELWARGDNRERQAVLKALSLLPEPERFAAIAIEACRSNVLTIFEAIACENPYPARYFPELPFNQMALKAAFTGVALARIAGLRERLNPELARMASDFAAERRAAGRSVPADLGLIIEGPSP